METISLLFSVLVLTAVYALVVIATILLLLAMGLPRGRVVLLSFLTFGFITGALAAWVWPLDSCTRVNLFATLLGDMVYNWAIQHLGNPISASAHTSIPWVLRLPQVYMPISLILSGIVGMGLQWVYNATQRSHNARR